MCPPQLCASFACSFRCICTGQCPSRAHEQTKILNLPLKTDTNSFYKLRNYKISQQPPVIDTRYAEADRSVPRMMSQTFAAILVASVVCSATAAGARRVPSFDKLFAARKAQIRDSN